MTELSKGHRRRNGEREWWFLTLNCLTFSWMMASTFCTGDNVRERGWDEHSHFQTILLIASDASVDRRRWRASSIWSPLNLALYPSDSARVTSTFSAGCSSSFTRNNVRCWSLAEKQTGREIVVYVARVQDSFLWFVVASRESSDSIASFRNWPLTCWLSFSLIPIYVNKMFSSEI